MTTQPTLSRNDGTLDAFIVSYCGEHGIRCDGDAFGIMFADQDEYSESESAALIERAADIYELR